MKNPLDDDGYTGNDGQIGDLKDLVQDLLLSLQGLVSLAGQQPFAPIGHAIEHCSKARILVAKYAETSGGATASTPIHPSAPAPHFNPAGSPVHCNGRRLTTTIAKLLPYAEQEQESLHDLKDEEAHYASEYEDCRHAVSYAYETLELLERQNAPPIGNIAAAGP